jgi:hypothetical protein
LNTSIREKELKFTAMYEHGGSADFIVSATGREFRALLY